MAILSSDQRNYFYLIEAERAGIHKPILAALYQAHSSPSLSDGEIGLGVSPANRVALSAVNTLPEQIQYAANAIRSLSDSLVIQGWSESDLWQAEQGRYTDQFLQSVAQGYAPPTSELTTARLEACNFDKLRQAYLAELETDLNSDTIPQNFDYLEQALLNFVEQIPDNYTRLPNQREGLLEAVRIWRKLDTREAAIASLVLADQVAAASSDESILDIPLKQCVQGLVANYRGYPQQREALLRLTQLWRQLGTREDAIASLKTNTSPRADLSLIDPALIAFVQRLPDYYQGQGSQRNALTEAFRLWYQLDSRATVLVTLGINPEFLRNSTPERTTLVNLATQLDRELINFARRLPGEYEELDHQREALISLVQLWHNVPSANQTIEFLLDNQRYLAQVASNAKEAPPKPMPVVILKRPERWTPENIQLSASIIEDGNFIWAEATHGGTQMPSNQVSVDAIIRLAKLAQQARDRIGRPFMVVSWYCPLSINSDVSGATTSRHLVGDAMNFFCEGLSGNQLYWFLDPWWSGGLGRYSKFPNLCYIDARNYRARWRN
ncbi:MAG TPA: D-Ala-D-Ala carboxypeptidase family metallohydrolase [Coleofasciculaceae cyanobacterium]|jgi:hypothetical protein